MAAVDFGEWAGVEGLVITLGGHSYTVSPPSVAAAKKILAAAVRGEVHLGIVPGPLPDAVQEVLSTITPGPGDHPALGGVYEEMAADGHPQVVIDRVAYYAVFYWARGREYADALARLLWTPRETAGGEEEPDPKPLSSSQRRTGRLSAWASQTRTGGTRITGYRRTSALRGSRPHRARLRLQSTGRSLV